jgi:hypothetical protein
MHDLEICAPLQTEHPAPRDCPKLVGSEKEAKLLESCLHRQLERNPVTTDDVCEFMPEAGKHVD